jgi:hypothetical protein
MTFSVVMPGLQACGRGGWAVFMALGDFSTGFVFLPIADFRNNVFIFKKLSCKQRTSGIMFGHSLGESNAGWRFSQLL